MKYKNLKSLLSQKEITVAEFAEQLQITRQGLQKSLDNNQLPSNKVLQACMILGISPNSFFEWPDDIKGSGNYASNIVGGNTQNSIESIKVLERQLTEKDKQISRLLRLLENLSKMDSGDLSLAAESPIKYGETKKRPGSKSGQKQ